MRITDAIINEAIRLYNERIDLGFEVTEEDIIFAHVESNMDEEPVYAFQVGRLRLLMCKGKAKWAEIASDDSSSNFSWDRTDEEKVDWGKYATQ